MRRVVGSIFAIHIDVLFGRCSVFVIVLLTMVGRRDLEDVVHLVVEVNHISIVFGIERTAQDIPDSINL